MIAARPHVRGVQKYFNACAPTLCTTRRNEHLSAAEVCARGRHALSCCLCRCAHHSTGAQVAQIVISLIGGLSVTIRTVVAVFYNAMWGPCFAKCFRASPGAAAGASAPREAAAAGPATDAALDQPVAPSQGAQAV